MFTVVRLCGITSHRWSGSHLWVGARFTYAMGFHIPDDALGNLVPSTQGSHGLKQVYWCTLVWHHEP